jgi:folate-binding protein YgfZ
VASRTGSLIIRYSMPVTALQAEISAQNAVEARPVAVNDYRGTAVARSFGDPQEEFSALLNRCGIYDLGFRSRVSLTGSDRVRWLNGMVTNNIRDLAVGQGVYAFLLNAQGRILGDMYVHNRGESLLVETDHSQVEKIIATFDHFIIMDDVEVANLGEEQTALGLAGPRSRELLNAAGIAVPELQPLQLITPRCGCDCGCVECTVIRGEDASQESYEIWLDPKDVYKTWQSLIAAGATPAGSDALERQRIAAGIPLYGVDIRERDLPQETGQMRALNFNKGCYVGQEIVERIRSRGNVHRRFSGFLIEGAADVPAGIKIVHGEKEVGEITSVTALRTGSDQRTVALGYIRCEVGLPGAEVMIGNTRATVVQLPIERAAMRQTDDAALQKG